MCRPSSREMSSLEKVRPGMSRRFFSQKMAQKDPLKWMPSTHANATRRSAKLTPLPIHRCAHSAFFATHGTVWMACTDAHETTEVLLTLPHMPATPLSRASADSTVTARCLGQPRTGHQLSCARAKIWLLTDCIQMWEMGHMVCSS